LTFPTANIALCKCKEGHKAFGVRFEEYENEWKATWAFVIKKEGAEERENYNKTKLKGLIRLDKDYPGCPYCGSRGFVICGECGGLNCNIHGGEEQFTCGWCGEAGSLVDYKGDGFNAGNDR
jgi:hypothetical protein